MKKLNVITKTDIYLENYNYVKVEYKKVETYNFYLRFIKKNFTPCIDCQTSIKTLLYESNILYSLDNLKVSLYQQYADNILDYSFFFNFIMHDLSKEGFNHEWTPCSKCQSIIRNIMLNIDELFIGNKDYLPPVELSMQYIVDGNSFIELENRPAIPQELNFLRSKPFI